MKILFLLPAETIYDKQERVMGARHTPCSRESLRSLKDLGPRLLELGATRVIASDLDEQCAAAIARRINAPVELWQSLRRFNWGKLHGTRAPKADKVYTEMEAIWSNAPDVPIKGGDSRTSYQKRIAIAKDRLESLRATSVVIAGEREIQQILGVNAVLQRNRIYQWESSRDNAAGEAQAVYATARRPQPQLLHQPVA